MIDLVFLLGTQHCQDSTVIPVIPLATFIQNFNVIDFPFRWVCAFFITHSAYVCNTIADLLSEDFCGVNYIITSISSPYVHFPQRRACDIEGELSTCLSGLKASCLY